MDEKSGAAASRQLTLPTVIGYLLGITIGIFALSSLFAGSKLIALALLAGALVITPGTYHPLSRALGISWSRGVRVASLIMFLALAAIANVVLGNLDEARSRVAENKAAEAPVGAIDVPSLVGKSLSEITSTLGKPSYDKEPTQLQLQNGTTEWDKSWEKNGVSLMATYDVATKKVTDLFVGRSTGFRNTDEIVLAGGLRLDDPAYTVEFVKAKNAAGYTGAIVRPVRQR